jgi:peptidoglycan LD-endopeptidase LytH
MEANRSMAPEAVARIFPFSLADARPLDLTGATVDVGDLAAFTAFIDRARGSAPALIGGYGERRDIYAASPLFGGARHDGSEPRVIHLGIDIWAPAGTPVAAPLAGVVHSFADNAGFGDYGPTIILEHAPEDQEPVFYTLYGHLARRSLTDLVVGRPVARGEVIAWLGEPHENGGWPPHLHVQRIADLGDHRGDFPGAARVSERDHYLRRCPDPTDLLR